MFCAIVPAKWPASINCPTCEGVSLQMTQHLALGSTWLKLSGAERCDPHPALLKLQIQEQNKIMF